MDFTLSGIEAIAGLLGLIALLLLYAMVRAYQEADKYEQALYDQEIDWAYSVIMFNMIIELATEACATVYGQTRPEKPAYGKTFQNWWTTRSKPNRLERCFFGGRCKGLHYIWNCKAHTLTFFMPIGDDVHEVDDRYFQYTFDLTWKDDDKDKMSLEDIRRILVGLYMQYKQKKEELAAGTARS